MKLADFSLLTDENIDPGVVQFLRSKGFDVFDIKEEKLQGVDDRTIISMAYKLNRVVVTEDGDFPDIIFTQRPDFLGAVHLRPGSFFTAYHVISIEALLQANPDIVPPFIISVEKKSATVRIKVRNALPGPS
jgi:predicted nuclease of predicted toxin-antitoxin system